MRRFSTVSFRAMILAVRNSAVGRGRVYVIPISMPQTCRSKLARQTAAIRVDLVPAMSRRSPLTANFRSRLAAAIQVQRLNDSGCRDRTFIVACVGGPLHLRTGRSRPSIG